MTTETETAFNDLLAEVQATHARMVEQLADDETTLLEAHKWVLSILQVAAEVNLWADKARPRFTEIVGPYKKWGGDNSDAFYYYAPIDPTRTYRVRLCPGDAVYMSLTVYGGPDDGRYSTRIVGSANSQETERDEDGDIHIVISPNDPASPAWPGFAWSRTPWPRSRVTISRTRGWDGAPPGASRPTTRPRPTARTTPTWPGASGPPRRGSVSRPASCPSRSARPTPSTRPTRCPPPPSAGPPATPPTPWAPSSWPTTRPSSSAGVRPSASSGTCACGTGCSTPTTTTTSG